MSWLVGWITSCFLPCKNDCERPLVSVRSIAFDKRKSKIFNSNDKNLSRTRTKYNKRQLNNRLIMKDKFVNDDSIVCNFEENGVKYDKGVNIYRRPSLLTLFEAEEEEDKRRMSVESRGSVEFEDNTNYFSFPVLDWEWIGSPVRMPKSEDQQHQKTENAPYVRFRL